MTSIAIIKVSAAEQSRQYRSDSGHCEPRASAAPTTNVGYRRAVHKRIVFDVCDAYRRRGSRDRKSRDLTAKHPCVRVACCGGSGRNLERFIYRRCLNANE